MNMIKKYTRLILIVSSFIFITKTASAQDPAFTQFYSNALYLNPALTGAMNNGCPKASLNYRDQWPGIGRTYVTYSSSFDMRLNPLAGGLGLLVHQDQTGSGNLNTLNISLMYAYHLKVNRTLNINFGLEASYRSLSLDWSELTFGDQIDPTYGFIYNTQEDIINNPDFVQYPDFSAGIVGYTNTRFPAYFGFAAHHITQPDQGFISVSNLPTKYTLHGGINFPLNRYKNNITTISPNFLWQKQQSFNQFNWGLYVNRGPIVGGLWTRHSTKNFDAFIVMFGLVQDAFKFGYSYDITISKLGESNTYGAHEVSFTLLLPCGSKKVRFNTISCPKF